MRQAENELGPAIKAARNNMHLSQEKLAELVDITPTHLKHIESGHRKPSIDVLFRIVSVLHMSIDDLIFPEQQNKSQKYRKAQILLSECDEHQLEVILAALGAIHADEQKDEE